MHPSLGKFWNPPSGMVFDNSTDQNVIGKFKTGKVVDLDENDIEKCRELSLKLDAKYESRSSSTSSLIENPKTKTSSTTESIKLTQPSKPAKTQNNPSNTLSQTKNKLDTQLSTNAVKSQITNMLFKKQKAPEQVNNDDDRDVEDEVVDPVEDDEAEVEDAVDLIKEDAEADDEEIDLEDIDEDGDDAPVDGDESE